MGTGNGLRHAICQYRIDPMPQIAQRRPEAEIVIPFINEQFYPLCALYRTALWRKAKLLLEKGERRLLALVDECRVQIVEQDALTRIDPDLRFLMNINTPQGYQRALRSVKEEV